MTRFIRSLLRSKKPQPQYVKLELVSNSQYDYDRDRLHKGKLYAFYTMSPDGNKTYTVGVLHEVEPVEQNQLHR